MKITRWHLADWHELYPVGGGTPTVFSNAVAFVRAEDFNATVARHEQQAQTDAQRIETLEAELATHRARIRWLIAARDRLWQEAAYCQVHHQELPPLRHYAPNATVKPGAWSDPVVWSKGVPRGGDHLVIRHCVTVDCAVERIRADFEPGGLLTLYGGSLMSCVFTHAKHVIDVNNKSESIQGTVDAGWVRILGETDSEQEHP